MNVKIAKAKVIEHLPQILSIISCVGVGAVAYFSGKNTLKAHCVLEEKREEKSLATGECVADLTFGEKVKAVWKYYIPTAAAMGLTMGSMIASQKISAAQLASMTAACGYMALNRQIAMYGIPDSNPGDKEDVQKVQETAASIALEKGVWGEQTGYGDELFIDGYSGRQFYSSKDAVMDGLREFESLCEETDDEGNINNYIAYNDLYMRLHIETNYFGDKFGWHITNDEDGFGTDPKSIDFDLQPVEVKEGGPIATLIILNEWGFPYDGFCEIC